MNDILLQDILLEHYGLRAVSTSSPDEKTTSSTVKIFDCGGEGKFVLKRSDWYSGFAKDPHRALGTVSKISNMLLKEGAPLPKIFENNKGELVTTGREGELFVLLAYMEGTQISGTIEEYRSAGTALARFHLSGDQLLKKNPDLTQEIIKDVPVEKPYEESVILYQEGFRKRILASHECSHPEVCASVSDNIATIDATIKYLETTPGFSESPKGILHNDFNYANGLYDLHGAFLAFLDTEQLGVGPNVWDIGNTLASFYSKFKKETPSELHRQKVEAFLHSYHTVHPLPVEDYYQVLSSTQRWDIMRILRTLRRHHNEGNRFPDLLPKISERLLPRIKEMPEVFAFLDKERIIRVIA